jgi:hypothetical protein
VLVVVMVLVVVVVVVVVVLMLVLVQVVPAMEVVLLQSLPLQFVFYRRISQNKPRRRL